MNEFVIPHKDGEFCVWGTSLAIEVTIHKHVTGIDLFKMLPSVSHRIEILV
jgi:hypothetical protein